MARVAGRKGFPAGQLLMIVILAIIGVYLWGQFTENMSCTATDVTGELHGCTSLSDTYLTFTALEETALEGTTLWIIKLLIIAASVFVGYTVVIKFAGGRMSRRDIMSLVMLGVAVYFIWVYFIAPSNLLGASIFDELTLDNIGKATAQKLGLV